VTESWKHTAYISSIGDWVLVTSFQSTKERRHWSPSDYVYNVPTLSRH